MTVYEDSEEEFERLSPVQLWLVVASGPVIWAIHLVVSYALVTLSCMWGFLQFLIIGMAAARFILVVFTVAVTLIMLYAGYLAFSNWRKLPASNGDGLGAPEQDRYRFMIFSAIALNGLFAIITLLSGMPGLFLPLCAT